MDAGRSKHELTATEELLKAERIEDLTRLTDQETKLMFPHLSPEIEHVEIQCKAGNTQYALAAIDEILRKDTPIQDLQNCVEDAAGAGDIDIVRALLSRGALATLGAAMAAISEGHLDVLSLLKAYGWDVNEVVDWRTPPALSLVVGTDVDRPLMTWSLDNGADPDVPCKIDFTALSIAVQHAPLGIVQLLLAHTKSDRPHNGQLLHHAAVRTAESREAVLQLVLQATCAGINDIYYHNHAFSFGMFSFLGLGTALHGVALEGRPDVAAMLVARGADLEIRNTLGQTAVEVAREACNDSVLDVLLDAEAAGS
nr:isoform er10 of ankyrin-1 [Quercus suber]